MIALMLYHVLGKSNKMLRQNWTNFHRLRKYKRKKESDINRWAHLYWRYHFKFYGDHIDLWELDNV